VEALSGQTVDDDIDRNGDDKLTINDRRVEGSTGVLEMAHEKGLQVHTWTFRNDASGYGFIDPKEEMTYYLDLGVDGLFTDFPDTGVAARDESNNAVDNALYWKIASNTNMNTRSILTDR
jgi:glycerophosphoryl diester phosphodiesterase